MCIARRRRVPQKEKQKVSNNDLNPTIRGVPSIVGLVPAFAADNEPSRSIMSKIEAYREKLKSLDSWDSYLLSESCLPGPRANLELAFAVALEGSEEQILGFAALDAEEAPKNTREEFLAFCGVIGLGYLAARGRAEHFALIRDRASDPRWRIREAVALGLQKYGKTSIESLLTMMIEWSKGSLLERRAVVATLCEPVLLTKQKNAMRIFDILEGITTSILEEEERRTDDFKVLRKTLGYGWSVAVAVHPDIGKLRMEKWIHSEDSDIIWIMRHNLKKNRLARMDCDWVRTQLGAIEG